jgi:hypothetical protein
MHREKVCTAEPDNKCRAFCLTTKLLPPFLFFTIIDMTREITIDDVIEFIIRNCDDREAMDKISRTSFPFTTKYLKNNQIRPKKYYFDKTWRDWSGEHKGDNLTTDYPLITYCNNETEEE